jgi:nucleoporin NDC1
VGANTATYPFKTFQRALLNPVTYFSIAAYLLSASAFAEVTALSYHSDSYVKLVNPGSHNERAHLNEQGIFFRSLFPILGLVQASYHFYHDIDRVRLPIDKVVVKEMKNIVTILKSKDMMISLAVGAAIKTFVAAVLGAITYFSIYRHLLWDWTLSFLRNFYFFPRNASSRRLLPNGLLSVWGSFLLTAFLLSLVWDFTNLVFSEYMAEQPVKKGQPITTGSKDPNGSLLSGLQAKNELPKVT